MPAPSVLTAYGLSFPDLAGARGLLRNGIGDEPTWRVRREVGTDAARSPLERITDAEALLPLGDGGTAHVDRTTSTTTLRTPASLTDREVVHPYLSSTAVVTALWRGFPALHAGAVLIDGGVFAVLGERGAGKSTAVWSLLQAGALHVSDDIVVVRDAGVLPGPRCVDLRRPAAHRLGVGEDLGVVGRRERWRVAVAGDLPADLPLRGFVHLAWSPDGRTSVEPVALAERLPAVAAAFAARVPRHPPRSIMQLAAVPAVRWSRPQDLDHVHDAAAALVSAVRRG